MPDTSSISRKLDWAIIKRELPADISKHLPNGDPLNNKQEIKMEIDRMIAFGPDGRKIIKRYVDGEINEKELERQLEQLSKNTDSKELQDFRRNIRIIQNSLDKSLWRRIIPFTQDIDIKSIKLAAKELNDLNAK